MLLPEQRNTDHDSEFGRICEAPKIDMINTKPPYHRIYLLTVWQGRNRGPPMPITWRFRLEDTRTGWKQAFADATALMAALQALDVAEGEGRNRRLRSAQPFAFILHAAFEITDAGEVFVELLAIFGPQRPVQTGCLGAKGIEDAGPA